ncbi:MAG TPA: glycolate oxidase subunit GlcF [Thiotrichales bacterium]|nr:glycolate oxidase subunit GlcF [Thiotrichales bacterium]
MKTSITQTLLQTPEGQHANRILRNCVHCGFCNATCPTYQLLGDELDGPRGRIYLIKQVLEGETPTRQTQQHLDRCLTCRNCESTCPSGVHYSHLLNIGRKLVNREVKRPLPQRLTQAFLRRLFLSRPVFSALLKTGQALRPLLPRKLKQSIPKPQQQAAFTGGTHEHKVLLVAGCVQPALQPGIDHAAKIVFDRLAIECIEPPTTVCCGSLSHHLNAEDEALAIMRANIDRWLPLVEQHNIRAITMTASGCGVAIKEYAQLLADDRHYADKAERISQLYKDPVEIISEALSADRRLYRKLPQENTGTTVVFHPPCTLQHGMQLKRRVEPILENCGFTLKPVRDAHLCCGSAGTYSITQKALSQQLLHNKLGTIGQADAAIIATANIGCQLHLQSGTRTPVRHWLELLAR